MSCQLKSRKLGEQEANRLMPGDSNTLALCSKAWSDITYLDDIKREKLTDEQKREVNAKAITYCEQVRSPL
jgi:hypothetical protein